MVCPLSYKTQLDACEPQTKQSRRLLPAKHDRLGHDPPSKIHKTMRLVLLVLDPSWHSISLMIREIESAIKQQSKQSFSTE